jgi:ABC-type nitrate/sulfonate/bicarbonate transport system ATPase subunit
MTERSASLALHSVSKAFAVNGRDVRALDDVSFSVGPGEFVSIVGPSGCGKSTLLRLVAGLEQPDAGEVIFAGTRVAGPSLQRGIVFQDHRLLPWLTVEANVGLGLLRSGLTAAQKRETAREYIALVGLNGFADAYPEQLSGGMAQRAAIARSLAARPRILLLDEPLGALDALTRRRMQTELLRIWEHERVTMVMVTHDVNEAVFLSDRIVVMDRNPGRIREIVDVTLTKPRNRHEADFTQAVERLERAFEGAAT